MPLHIMWASSDGNPVSTLLATMLARQADRRCRHGHRAERHDVHSEAAELDLPRHLRWRSGTACSPMVACSTWQPASRMSMTMRTTTHPIPIQVCQDGLQPELHLRQGARRPVHGYSLPRRLPAMTPCLPGLLPEVHHPLERASPGDSSVLQRLPHLLPGLVSELQRPACGTSRRRSFTPPSRVLNNQIPQ